MCGTIYKASTNFKFTHNLSMLNVTLQSIAIGIVYSYHNENGLVVPITTYLTCRVIVHLDRDKKAIMKDPCSFNYAC